MILYQSVLIVFLGEKMKKLFLLFTVFSFNLFSETLHLEEGAESTRIKAFSSSLYGVSITKNYGFENFELIDGCTGSTYSGQCAGKHKVLVYKGDKCEADTMKVEVQKIIDPGTYSYWGNTGAVKEKETITIYCSDEAELTNQEDEKPKVKKKKSRKIMKRANKRKSRKVRRKRNSRSRRLK